MNKGAIFIVHSPEDGREFANQLSSALREQSYDEVTTLAASFVCLLLITPSWLECADCMAQYQASANSANAVIALYNGHSPQNKAWLANAKVAMVIDFTVSFADGLTQLWEALETLRWTISPKRTTNIDIEAFTGLVPDFAVEDHGAATFPVPSFTTDPIESISNLAEYLSRANLKSRSKGADVDESPNIVAQTTLQNPDQPTPKDAERYERYIEAREKRQTTVEQDKQRQREQYYGDVKMDPIFGPPDKSPKFQCDIFVIIPFASEFKPIFDLIEGIAKSMNLIVKRGDSWNFSKKNIMHEVWSALCASRIVIADCSGLNANVFYELGIAHMLGRQTILITRDIEKAAFDTRDRRHIVYENTIGGGEQLRQALTDTIGEILQYDLGN